MNSELIYLASPYSHQKRRVREERHQDAALAAGTLMNFGLHVYSPIAHSHAIAEYSGLPLGYDFWQQFDERMMRLCDRMIVLMIDGWQESEGIKLEVAFFESLGKPVEYWTQEGLQYDYWTVERKQVANS